MKKLNRWNGFLAVCLSAALLSGCGSTVPIVSEVRENQGYSNSQTMLLVANEKNRYGKVYGNEIWQVQVDEDGTTFQAHLLGEIKRFIKELKTMNLLAEDQKITLTGQEKEDLKELADAYYRTLSAADLAYTGVEEEDVYLLYEQYHLANKLVDELTKDVNLEISDSEAKIITVEEIVMDDEAAASEVYAQVSAEGADFAALAKEYSKDIVIQKQVGRSERKKEYEDAVFNLTPGQISPVIALDGSYYIVKCISDYDEAATVERKKNLALLRKDQAFRQIYDEFAKEHPIEIKGSLWDELSFDGKDGSVTDSFFQVYHEYWN